MSGDHITIKKVDSYGEETATVVVDSGQLSIEVFCHLGDYRQGDLTANLLHVLDADIKAAFLSDWPQPTFTAQEFIKQTGPYSYVGRATAIDPENQIIEVKGFRIEVGELPAGVGQLVDFTITRLDLWSHD